MSYFQILIIILIGLIAGFAGGSLGIGGGLIIVPSLMFIMGFSQHEAQGTSIAMMLAPIGILAAINYHKEGYINYKYAIILAIAFIIGGYLGSLLAIKIDEKLLKKIFGVFIILIGIKMVLGK